MLELLADHGVDDVEIIIATGIHRRMKANEVRHMVGDQIFDAYWPERLYNHDAEDTDNLVVIGETDHGEVLELNRRAAESDLVIYVNLNFVPDERRVQVGGGRPVQLPRACARTTIR